MHVVDQWSLLMQPSNPQEIGSFLAALATCSLTDLRQCWAKTFDEAAPTAARSDYLVRAIGYHVQAKMYGDLAPSVARRLKKVLNARHGDRDHLPQRTHSLRPGARLLREWQGDTHEIEITDSGFRYRDKTYKSLSVIARLITGTRWSGPLFFGLRSADVKVVKSERPKTRSTYVVDLGSRSQSDKRTVKRPQKHGEEVHAP